MVYKDGIMILCFIYCNSNKYVNTKYTYFVVMLMIKLPELKYFLLCSEVIIFFSCASSADFRSTSCKLL